jgi:hypothetical protein
MLKLFVVAVVVGLAPAAFAQDALPTAGEATGDAGSGGVVYKKETTYDFDGDDVEGNLVKPDEANISGEQHGKTSSLIKIRADFIPEMIKSVENI